MEDPLPSGSLSQQNMPSNARLINCIIRTVGYKPESFGAACICGSGKAFERTFFLDRLSVSFLPSSV